MFWSQKINLLGAQNLKSTKLTKLLLITLVANELQGYPKSIRLK